MFLAHSHHMFERYSTMSGTYMCGVIYQLKVKINHNYSALFVILCVVVENYVAVEYVSLALDFRLVMWM